MQTRPPAVRESLEFIQAPGLPGVQCMWAENCSQHFKWFHETYTITAMTDGVGEYVTAGKAYQASANTLQAWEPGDTHRVTQIPPAGRYGMAIVSQRAVLLDPAIVRRAAEECGIASSALHLKGHDLHAPRAFRALTILADSLQGQATPLERESNLALFLQSMLENVLETQGIDTRKIRETRGVRRAIEYLIGNSTDGVTLKDLVAETGMDQFRLLRAFTREVGFTPHAFLIQLRLAQARKLLTRGIPAASAAASTGFSDQSHMIRCFRTSAGITPSRFCPK